ncbi:MAG: hypothetical protein LUE14_04555 [Clostridiales bacterium]|nr:hypothetical protein [Clostridiales bacterium]
MREIYKYNQIETVYKKQAVKVSRIMAGEDSCEITLEADPPLTIHGKSWAYAGYEKYPLVFIPFESSDEEKIRVLSKLDEAYGAMETDVAEWSVEFQLFTRMLLCGYLMVNPIYIESWYLTEHVVLPALGRHKETLSVTTPKGLIEASVIPDPEYPGIALLYKNGDDEPGVIMDYSPDRDMVQMQVYPAENTGDEPAVIYDMILPKENILLDMVVMGKITDSAVVTCKQDHTGTFVNVNYKFDPKDGFTDYVTVFASIAGEKDEKTAWEEAERIADAAATLLGLEIVEERN